MISKGNHVNFARFVLLAVSEEAETFQLPSFCVRSMYNKTINIIDSVFVGGAVASWLVRALDTGASGPGSSPGRGQCVVFLGMTLYSHSASLHPGV